MALLVSPTFAPRALRLLLPPYREPMKTHPKSHVPKGTTPDVSLTKVLGQNEQVKDLVEEAAEDLSALNTDLRKKLVPGTPPAEVKNAIKKSEAAEDKVLEAADKLTVVNEDLESEIQELHALHQKFAVTLNQAESSRHAALHDVLTGLPNRALFLDRLEHGVEQAKRHGWTLAVLFVDLDGFKKINDSYGHEAGDNVLKTIADRLKKSARADDTVSRHGGDEFLYLMMGSGDAVDIAAIATNIVKVIQASCAITVHGVTIRVRIGASIGIAIYPQDGNSSTALVSSADKAMYAAKRGKSGHTFASATTS